MEDDKRVNYKLDAINKLINNLKLSIYVKNYIVFYVVIDDIMEVRRLLYNRKKYKDDL